MRPHRWQPTRLLRPWDSPGKNTGVGCHLLLQCMKVKSESEVAQSCLTLLDPMDCSPPGSSIHGIFQARVLGCHCLLLQCNDMSSIPGSGRSHGERSSNTLQYFCLGNRMDRGAWRAAVHGARVRHDLVNKQKVIERKLLWNLSLQPNLSQCQDLISSFFYCLQVFPAFCWIFKWLPLPSGENLASTFRDSQNPLCM